jgi:hypothetical protein
MGNLATLTWFSTGAIILYIVVRDPNVYDWLVLQSKRIVMEARRAWFMTRHHPSSPWVRYEVKRNSMKLAKEILKEIKNR